jgi:hypothetical protein
VAHLKIKLRDRQAEPSEAMLLAAAAHFLRAEPLLPRTLTWADRPTCCATATATSTR